MRTRTRKPDSLCLCEEVRRLHKGGGREESQAGTIREELIRATD